MVSAGDLEAEKERGAAAEASVEELEAALRSSQSEAAALRGKVADSAAQPPRESAHQLTRERAAWEAERAKLVAENEASAAETRAIPFSFLLCGVWDWFCVRTVWSEARDIWGMKGR